MFFKKSNVFSNVRLRYNSHRTFKSLPFNSYRIHRFPYSNIIMASAAALGISVYVAYKNKIVCDIDPNIENQIVISPQDKYREAIERSRDIIQRVKVYEKYNYSA